LSEIEQLKLDIKRYQKEVNATAFQMNATVHQVNATVLQVNAAVLQVNATSTSRICMLNETLSAKIDMNIANIAENAVNIEELEACNAYRNLDSPTRIKTYMSPQQDNACDLPGRDSTSDDWFGPGWYRFTGSSGTMLATSVVPGPPEEQTNRCGTDIPGYLKGGKSSLPTLVGETVNAVVCFNWEIACRYQTNIQIRKCSTFYLYWLPNTPGCPLGYCGE